MYSRKRRMAWAVIHHCLRHGKCLLARRHRQWRKNCPVGARRMLWRDVAHYWGPPSATVRADEDITVWALPEADFLTLIRTCPTLLQNINAILSRRLARTNRQIHSQVTAEKIWLSLVHNPDVLLERSLIIHIADALARRSRKRVLMLESCGQDQAMGPHFATLTNQLRPALLDCVQDHSLLQ